MEHASKKDDKILEYNKYFYNIDNYVDNNNSLLIQYFLVIHLKMMKI